jgi:hypothetical protein
MLWRDSPPNDLKALSSFRPPSFASVVNKSFRCEASKSLLNHFIVLFIRDNQGELQTL